ncbi:MAG: DUF4080 domain-containing protein [Eubacteriales bacterium]|nr:DUF4080 domain-containing protein [Eubacteriales bacterium]
MKIALTTLNAKYIHSNLALRYLFAVAGQARNTLEIREFTINHEDDYIYTELLRGEYGAICFSCYIWNIERILYLAETIKKAKPDLIIVLGGPEAGHRGEELLKNYKAIDLIVMGEGEETFPDLLALLLKQSPRDLEAISGLIYRRNGDICVNPAREVDFNQVPFPYSYTGSESDKIVYYESSRGCPFSCSYCLSSTNLGVRSLSLEQVKRDLSFFIHNKVKQVKLVDRTFNYDKIRAIEIFRYLMNVDNKFTNFHFELCGELMNEEMLQLLEKARPGLFQFEIGIQSTNQPTLDAINRKGDFSKLSANVRRLRSKNNIHLHLDLIAGLPFEDYDTFAHSFNQVYALKPHHLQLGFLKLLPGTQIRRQADDYEYVYRDHPPYEVISNRFLSAEGLARIKMLETVFSLYYNRGGFSNTLDFATGQLGMEAFCFYEELAYFYHLKGFQHRSHRKESLYRILHLYGWWKDKYLPGTGKKMEQILLQDINQSLNSEVAKKIQMEGWGPEG